MAYVSRHYLKEKYSNVKWDMENVLRVLDTDLEDSVDVEDVSRVFNSIKMNMEAILKELESAV